MASRCGISRRASNIRRSAAGSRRDRAAISPASTPISTISSKACASSRRAACWRRAALPGSGAGPSPDRLFIGSEGMLGVISRAWMRLQPRPKFRAGASVRFRSFFAAARAVRAIAQAGLYPSNCRILDPQEAFNTGAADGSVAIMVLALRIRRSSARRLDGARARMLRRPWRHAGGREGQRRASAKAPPASGATPSFACPMRASF